MSVKKMLLPLLASSLFAFTLSGCGSSGSSSGGGTTATVAGAPTIGAATAGNASASIAFTAPSSNGGATITSYTASCTGGGATVTGTGTASPITVSNLINGTAYNCSVTATNSVGTSAASSTVSVTPSAGSGSVSTSSVLCPTSGTYTGSYSSAGTLTSTWSWSCNATTRTLTANGLPNHTVGTFPGAGNPNTIAAVATSFSATLTPSLSGTNNTNPRTLGYSLTGVKFEPGTAGTCLANATNITTQCDLAMGNGGTFRVEALGQTTFNFGTDTNNAHVQPTGEYHYHGMPEGLLTNAGASSTNPKMVLIGWAPDGYPVYARYGYSIATNASSSLKVITGSYSLVSTPATGRPSTTLVPLGAFVQDWQYVAGSGDLDDCNGRFGVTPEFPNGVYHYYATDSYPYMTRCWKGTIN